MSFRLQAISIPELSQYSLLPKAIKVALLPLSASTPSSTYPQERQLLPANAHPKRRHIFLLGRQTARQALAQLSPDLANATIGRNSHGLPLWPAGVTGSISHAGKWALAAVAWKHQLAALGADLEQERPLFNTQGLAKRILSEQERRQLTSPYRLLEVLAYFSAKESVFKATYSRWQTWLGFLDIKVTITPLNNTESSSANWQQLHWQAQGNLPSLQQGKGLIWQKPPWVLSLCWMTHQADNQP